MFHIKEELRFAAAANKAMEAQLALSENAMQKRIEAEINRRMQKFIHNAIPSGGAASSSGGNVPPLARSSTATRVETDLPMARKRVMRTVNDLESVKGVAAKHLV